jgi:FMN phosphatase YigB (HAD superfamily)
MRITAPVRAACFDWGGTLMSEVGPQDRSMAYWPEVTVINAALEAVADLSRVMPLFVATNASISYKADIVAALERAGLSTYFTDVFCFMEIEFKKNQREFWQVVESVTKLPLQHIAMVGDSLEYDTIAPRSFGVQSVWIDPLGQSQFSHQNLPVVSNLVEFSKLVQNAA